MSATSALVLEILEAALSCDDERAMRLAEEAGCTRFELSQVRRHAHRDEIYVEIEDDAAEERGHEQGWNGALNDLLGWLDGFEELTPDEATLLGQVVEQVEIMLGPSLKAVAA